MFEFDFYLREGFLVERKNKKETRLKDGKEMRKRRKYFWKGKEREVKKRSIE